MDGSSMHVRFEFTSQGIGIPNNQGVSNGPRFYMYEQWWEKKDGRWKFRVDGGKPIDRF